MKSPQPAKPIIKVFSASFRQHVRLLLVWGLEQSKEDITTTEDEEAISGFLRDGVEKVLHSNQKRWFKYYDIHNEDPIASKNRAGKDRRKIDLIIRFVHHPDRPEYVFEAKPLNAQKPYQQEENYYGSKGLRRFLDGEYAERTSRYPEVAMLGYILTDTQGIWCQRLKAAIASQELMLELLHPQLDEVTIPELPHEWVSEHRRDSASTPIKIYHILLPCR